MTDPARYRLPGRRGWWRDLFTLLGIAAMVEILTDLLGWEPSFLVFLVVFVLVAVPLAAALGVLSERPRTEDDW